MTDVTGDVLSGSKARDGEQQEQPRQRKKQIDPGRHRRSNGRPNSQPCRQ